MKKLLKFLFLGAGMLYASTIAKVLAPDQELDRNQAQQNGPDEPDA